MDGALYTGVSFFSQSAERGVLIAFHIMLYIPQEQKFTFQNVKAAASVQKFRIRNKTVPAAYVSSNLAACMN